MSKALKQSNYYFSIGKLMFDLVLSSLGLLALSPVIVILMLTIKIGSKGPPFFIQKRIGLNGKPFKTIMFRTMYVGADRDQKKFAHLNEADGPVFKINKFVSGEINKLVFRRLKINKFVHCFASPPASGFGKFA